MIAEFISAHYWFIVGIVLIIILVVMAILAFIIKTLMKYLPSIIVAAIVWYLTGNLTWTIGIFIFVAVLARLTRKR